MTTTEYLRLVAYNNPIGYSEQLMIAGLIPASYPSGKELFDFVYSITERFPYLLAKYITSADAVQPNLYGESGTQIAADITTANAPTTAKFGEIYEVDVPFLSETLPTDGGTTTSDYSWLQPVLAGLSTLPSLIGSFSTMNQTAQMELQQKQDLFLAEQKERQMQMYMLYGLGFAVVIVVLVLVINKK